MSNKLAELFKRHKGDADTLIETGTYHGDGVQAALEAGVERVISFETNYGNYKLCRDRFADGIAEGTVRLYNESTEVTHSFNEEVIANNDRGILFWLDAHRMDGKTGVKWGYPLLEELKTICMSARPCHTILMDDVRLFERFGTDVAEVSSMLLNKNPHYNFKLETAKPGYPGDVLAAWVNKGAV